jgi:hypothetical protein
MRSLLSLVALCALSSVPLTADMFNITFLGSLSGRGTFSTDGTCTLCQVPGFGLLNLTINIGTDSGTGAFDISDDGLGLTLYQRPPNNLAYTGTNSETNDFLDMKLNIWSLTRAGGTVGSGTFSVRPAASVPEPRSLFLLMPIVALVGLRWRHQRHRAS